MRPCRSSCLTHSLPTPFIGTVVSCASAGKAARTQRRDEAGDSALHAAWTRRWGGFRIISRGSPRVDKAAGEPREREPEREAARRGEGRPGGRQRFAANQPLDQEVLRQRGHEHQRRLRLYGEDACDRDRHGRHEQHDAKPGLGFLVGARERGDDREERRGDQRERRDDQEHAPDHARPEVRGHAESLERHGLQRQRDRGGHERERGQHHHGRRRDLAVDQVLADHGQGQQRLQRAALALARRRVDREVEAAHQRREQDDVAQHAEQQRRARRGRRDVHVVDHDRLHDRRRDAARQQAQVRDPRRIARDHGGNSRAVLAGLGVRAVGEELDRRGPAGGEALAERLRDAQDDEPVLRGRSSRGYRPPCPRAG